MQVFQSRFIVLPPSPRGIFDDVSSKKVEVLRNVNDLDSARKLVVSRVRLVGHFLVS